MYKLSDVPAAFQASTEHGSGCFKWSLCNLFWSVGVWFLLVSVYVLPSVGIAGVLEEILGEKKAGTGKRWILLLPNEIKIIHIFGVFV